MCAKCEKALAPEALKVDGAADAPAAAADDEGAACEEASQTSVCGEAMSQESSDGYIDRLGARRWVEANAAGGSRWTLLSRGCLCQMIASV